MIERPSDSTIVRWSMATPDPSMLTGVHPGWDGPCPQPVRDRTHCHWAACRAVGCVRMGRSGGRVRVCRQRRVGRLGGVRRAGRAASCDHEHRDRRCAHNTGMPSTRNSPANSINRRGSPHLDVWRARLQRFRRSGQRRDARLAAVDEYGLDRPAQGHVRPVGRCSRSLMNGARSWAVSPPHTPSSRGFERASAKQSSRTSQREQMRFARSCEFVVVTHEE